MPLYEYSCDACGLNFEELVTLKNSETQPCQRCGAVAQRKMSAFAQVVHGGGSNESVDMQIGRQANQRWQKYHDQQSKRHEGKELKTLDLPKVNGKYAPLMGLGEKKEQETRKQYVSALQKHRKQRQEKGISQFTEKGAF